jgi:malonate transporter
MVLNSLFPVFALILIGRLLRYVSITNETFLKTADRVIYYIFFPVLLFWKIGATSAEPSEDVGFYLAAICAVVSVYILSSLYITLFKVPDYQAGSFSQSCYRFNTYIGMAIILNALGEKGTRQFGILIGMIIPLINILAVTTLTWFSEKTLSLQNRVGLIAKALIFNPLILACIAGMGYSKLIGGFPLFVDNTFRMASYVTLPLALLSIGGSLTLASIKNYLKLSMIASVFKLLVLPISGYFFMKAFAVSGISFKVGMIYFTLPTSTALYVLSSQLSSDTKLASASIALSTILSFFSLSLALVF